MPSNRRKEEKEKQRRKKQRQRELKNEKEVIEELEKLSQKKEYDGKGILNVSREVSKRGRGNKFPPDRVKKIIENNPKLRNKFYYKKAPGFKKIGIVRTGEEHKISKNQLKILKHIEKEGKAKKPSEITKEEISKISEETGVSETQVKKSVNALKEMNHPLVSEKEFSKGEKERIRMFKEKKARERKEKQE